MTENSPESYDHGYLGFLPPCMSLVRFCCISARAEYFFISLISIRKLIAIATITHTRLTQNIVPYVERKTAHSSRTKTIR